MRHLADLGFVVNREKSVLTQRQEITFLVLMLNSFTYTACLSAERVDTFRCTLAYIKTGHVWAVSQTGGTDDLSAVGGESGQCV